MARAPPADAASRRSAASAGRNIVGPLEYIDKKGRRAFAGIDNPEPLRLWTDILPNIEKYGLKRALGAAHCHACRSKGVACPGKDCACDGGYQSGTCGSSVCG